MLFYNNDILIEKEIFNGFLNKIFEDFGLKLMLEFKIFCCVKDVVFRIFWLCRLKDLIV